MSGAILSEAQRDQIIRLAAEANAGEIVAAAQDAEDGEEDNGGGTAL